MATTRRSLVFLTTVGALALASCAGSDFVTIAEGEGIQVYEQQLARDTVADLCRSLDENANPMGALFALADKRANDPPFSTDDSRVLQLGVDNQCSQHSEVFAGMRATFDPNAGPGGGFGGESPPYSETPVPPVVLPFGEQIATDEGLQVSMSASMLEGWTPDEYIPGDMVKLTVTATNNSTEALTPDSVVCNVLSREGGPAQTWALGEEDGITPSQGDLLPGESETFNVAVEMDDATKPLRVQLCTSGDVYFEGVPAPAGTEPPAPSTYVDPLEGADEGYPPTSGEEQYQYGCEQGYIPADQC